MSTLPTLLYGVWHTSPPVCLSYNDCLEGKRENYQNCSALCCVQLLCTKIRYTLHMTQFLKLRVCLSLRFCLFGFSILCFFCFSIHYLVVVFLWPPCVIEQAIIFFPCGFFLSFYLSFFPRLISAATDWMSTMLLHMAWP